MFVRLRRTGEIRTFSTWILRESGLARGSGLFVDRRGIACDHHFLLPRDGQVYKFDGGRYDLEVFVSVVGRRQPLLLTRQTVSVSEEEASAIHRTDAGLFFDWTPDERRYISHLDRNRTAELNAALSETVRLPQSVRIHTPDGTSEAAPS
jgi:hypothetical protein